MKQTSNIEHRHWHYIFHKRRRVLGISAKQMATSQVFSLFGSIIAGVLLDLNKESLVLVAGVFVILPGVFDLDGSIGAALSAKINHTLEDESLKKRTVFIDAIWFALRLCAASGLLVGFFGGLTAAVFFEADFWRVFTIGWGAIMLSGLVGFPVIASMSVFFRSKNINPDDVVGPIESSIFDILTVLSISLMVRLIA